MSAVSTLLLTTWSLSACYIYVPTSTVPTREVTGAVRVFLTPAGSEALGRSLGANVRQIEGVVARNSTDTLVLAVQRTITIAGEGFASSGDTVAVQRRYVESVAVPQYSRKRSVGLAVAIVSFVIIALTSIVAGSSGTSGTGQPGPSQP